MPGDVKRDSSQQSEGDLSMSLPCTLYGCSHPVSHSPLEDGDRCTASLFDTTVAAGGRMETVEAVLKRGRRSCNFMPKFYVIDLSGAAFLLPS